MSHRVLRTIQFSKNKNKEALFGLKLLEMVMLLSSRPTLREGDLSCQHSGLWPGAWQWDFSLKPAGAFV